MGLLSFDRFGLDLSERVTFVVGPNGVGKSNMARLLTICLRAVESGDGAAGDVDRLLAAFLAARHVGSNSPDVEARVAVQLTDVVERELLTEFVRAMVTGAMTAHGQIQNSAEIDAWAKAEITEVKLRPLMEGEIVASHPGTPDGRWQCAYEFTAPGFDQSEHRYRWILLGLQSGAIFDADAPMITQGRDIATRIMGTPSPSSGPVITVPGGFRLRAQAAATVIIAGVARCGCTFCARQRHRSLPPRETTTSSPRPRPRWRGPRRSVRRRVGRARVAG